MSGKGLRGMRAAKCPHCGGMRLVGVAERPEDSPHAPRIVGGAADGKWPVCEHGLPWLIDCRNAPVPPACCLNVEGVSP